MALRWTWGAMALVGFALSHCAAGSAVPSTGGGGEGGTPGTGASGAAGGAGGSGGSVGTAGMGGEGGIAGTGGMGGAGGVAGTGGMGGAGGMAGTGGAGGMAGTGGGTPVGQGLLLAAGNTSLFGAALSADGVWTTTDLGNKSNLAPSVALANMMSGLGLFRGVGGADEGKIFYVSWATGAFGVPQKIGDTITSPERPGLGAADPLFHMVFRGDNSKHYHGVYNGAWAPPAEGVDPPGDPPPPELVQAFGPSTPSVCAVGADLYVAYAGDNGQLYVQRKTGGAWETAIGLGGCAQPITVTPTLVRLTGASPDLLIVAVCGNNQAMWSERNAGTWSAPTVISDATTAVRVGVAPVADGGAVIALRALDGKIYTAKYSPSGFPIWTTPKALASPNPSTPSTPAVAPGIGGFIAELAFVSSADSKVYHSRLSADWSAPALVGGAALLGVDIATSQ